MGGGRGGGVVVETGSKDCHIQLGERALKSFSEQEHGREFVDCQGIPSKDTVYTDSGEGKARSVWYSESMWESSQRHFHSTLSFIRDRRHIFNPHGV